MKTLGDHLHYFSLKMRFGEKIVLTLKDKPIFSSKKIKFGEKILLTLENVLRMTRARLPSCEEGKVKLGLVSGLVGVQPIKTELLYIIKIK